MVEAALRRRRGPAGIRSSADGSIRPLMEDLTPAEIVAELDRYVIGQIDAKRAVAVALRNRFRRQLLSEELRREITPKNILMIGPTGVGKTEIARRVARIVDAPHSHAAAERGWSFRNRACSASSNASIAASAVACIVMVMRLSMDHLLIL